jgi:hypothetical protein
MGDSFSFGEPAKKWSGSKLTETPSRGPRLGGLGGRALAVVGLLVVLALLGAYFLFLRDAGESIADAESDAVGQIGNAQDLQAQVNLTNASHAALALSAEASIDPTSGGFAAADPEALTAMAGGGVSFTSGESLDPSSISVATAQNEWAAAALSESGTCLYVHIETDVVLYGSGQACTGDAAMSAIDQAW